MREYFGTVIEVLERINEDGPAGIDPQYLCQHYASCQTAKALSMDFCSRYKCNTFYHLRNREKARADNDARPDISRVVSNHLQQITPGNGNGHTGGRKGMPSKLKCIS